MSLLTNVIERVKKEFEQKYSIFLQVDRVIPVAGGCINQAHRLETNQGLFFLKWNQHATSDLFLREEESLIEMQKAVSGNLLIPKPLLSSTIDNEPGYLLTEWLQHGNCSKADEMLGSGLAQMHRMTNEKFGFWHSNYCGETPQSNQWSPDWIEFYKECRLRDIILKISCKREWSLSDFNVFDLFLNRLENILRTESIPSLVHGDLWLGNYMYTSKGPAIFDPACSYSHREYEFGMISLFGGFTESFFSAYQEAYPLENGWRERIPVYRLYHILNHYLLFGGSYKNEAIQLMKRYL